MSTRGSRDAEGRGSGDGGGGDGLDFRTFTPEDLGARSEDGVTTVDEFIHHIHRIASLCADDRFTSKGRVPFTVDIESDGTRAVMITPKIEIKRPRRRHQGVVGFLGADGKVKVQDSHQIELPGVSPIRVDRKKDPGGGLDEGE